MIGIWNFHDKSVKSIQVDSYTILRVDDDRKAAALFVGSRQFSVSISDGDNNSPVIRIDEIGTTAELAGE